MTDLKGVHDWIDFITNKAIGQYFTPPEIDAALHRGQMAHFNTLYSTSYLAEKIHDGLAPFKAYPNYSFLTSDTPSGLLTLPTTYQYLTGGHIIVVNGSHTEYNKIEIYAEDEISVRLMDQIKPVSASKPVATIAGRDPATQQTKIQLYPKTAMAGEIFYLRQPTAPMMAFTQTGRTITYDPDASVQLEWNEVELNDVMLAALEYLGVSEDDVNIAQYANQKEKEID